MNSVSETRRATRRARPGPRREHRLRAAAQQKGSASVSLSSGGSNARREGFLAVEVILVTLVLIVALQIFAEITVATTRQRAINQENALAIEASRSTIEHIKGLPLRDVFALYNDDPTDDPIGLGTAPGSRFVVSGLAVAEGVLDGTHGRVNFPTGEGLPGVLREDIVDRDLGMPRDLNGDGVIDGNDHSADYTILPLELRIEWKGPAGLRELSQHVLLTNMKP